MRKEELTKDDVNVPGLSFNMTNLFYQGLHQLIITKDQAYANADFEKWVRCLELIYHKIVFKLNSEEKAELETLLSDARSDMESKCNISRFIHIDKRLIILIDKYNMIFPDEKKSFGEVDKNGSTR